MHSDLPRWWAFVQRMREEDGQVEEGADKTASRGAESAREGRGEGGQSARILSRKKK